MLVYQSHSPRYIWTNKQPSTTTPSCKCCLLSISMKKWDYEQVSCHLQDQILPSVRHTPPTFEKKEKKNTLILRTHIEGQAKEKSPTFLDVNYSHWKTINMNVSWPLLIIFLCCTAFLKYQPEPKNSHRIVAGVALLGKKPFGAEWTPKHEINH